MSSPNLDKCEPQIAMLDKNSKAVSNSVRNSLLQYQQLLINQARKYLRAKYPEAVSVDGMVFGIQA